MKVTLQENYRSLYTLEDLDHAKAVIAYVKDDSSKPADYAKMALKNLADEFGGHVVEVITATAHTAKYCNAWNAYGLEEDTGNMDVQVDGIGKVWTEKGGCFVEFSAMLTDIWNDRSTPEGTWYKVYRSEN